MDPSIFLQYSPPNGLPQESKLATYMNRSASTSSRSLNQAIGKLSLDSSPTAIKKVFISEFVPVNYFNPPPPMLPDSPESSPPTTLAVTPQNTQVHQENVGGTTYFYSGSSPMGGTDSCMAGPVPTASGQPTYASQIYSGTPTHIGPMTSKPGLASSFYMPETIRSEIYQRNEDVFLQPDIRQYPDVPENVEMYSELISLENASPHAMASSYRATHRESAEHYALRRLHTYSPVTTKRLDMWKQIDHPNVVRLHEYFTTKAFGDHSMVLVYDYHPACVSLMNKYLAGSGGGSANDANGAFHDPFSSDPDAPRPYTHQKNAMLRAVACGALLPEAVLWSLLVQLTAALRAVHTAGLACRSLDPTKVVMNGCRVRIAWCGAADALHANTNDVAQAQQEDLTDLGRLALALACRSMHCDNLAASMELVARTYSADLKNLILYAKSK